MTEKDQCLGWEDAKEKHFSLKLMERWKEITAELKRKLPEKAIPIRGLDG